jgi:hypothetical protein
MYAMTHKAAARSPERNTAHGFTTTAMEMAMTTTVTHDEHASLSGDVLQRA